MSRFNPFKPVNCTHGAPLGRPGDPPCQYDGQSTLYARHCGGDGYYDRGGAYWGHNDIWAVWTRGGSFCAYVDGVHSKAAAIAKVREAAQ